MPSLGRRSAPRTGPSRAQLLRTLGLSGTKATTSTTKAQLNAVEQRIRALTPAQVVSLVAAGEGLAAKHGKQKPVDAEIGEHVRVAIDQIHPGQTQLSFDHVREKMLELLERAKQNEPVLEPGDLSGLRGPGKSKVVLLDGHHKLAALLALRAIFEPETLPLLSAKLTPNAANEVKNRILEVARSPGVEITTDLGGLEGAAFWSALASGEADAAIYLRRRDGTEATKAPSRFSELADNPFRELASAVSVKAKRTGPKRKDFELKGQEYPVWIKDPVAPDFIEFRIGGVFESALAAHGIDFDPKKPVSKKTRAILAEALSKAALDPTHPEQAFFADLVIVESPVSIEALRPLIKVGRKRGRVRWKD